MNFLELFSNMSKNYKQGYFKPKNPKKYKGNVKNIFYRSSWERTFMNYLDQRSNVIAWSSEEIVVPYVSPLDGKYHRYFLDFWLKFKDSDGKIKEKIIEIKPFKETKEPELPKSGRKTQRYIREATEYSKNQSKWEAAKKFAERKNMKFQVITENELFGKKK